MKGLYAINFDFVGIYGSGNTNTGYDLMLKLLNGPIKLNYFKFLNYLTIEFTSMLSSG